MKVLSLNSILFGFIIIISNGCSPDISSVSGENNYKEVCFTIKDFNTNTPIQGATIELKQYSYPDCIYCPYSSKNEESNFVGKACMDLIDGWWCEESEVTKGGYQPKLFNGKPPSVIYLSRIPN